MAMQILIVKQEMLLKKKKDRCSVLSVQNIYSMPYGTKFCFTNRTVMY